MKTALIIWVLLSAPVTLIGMGWGLTLIYRTAGLGPFLVFCVSYFTAGVAVASILDKRQPLPTRKANDR